MSTIQRTAGMTFRDYVMLHILSDQVPKTEEFLKGYLFWDSSRHGTYRKPKEQSK